MSTIRSRLTAWIARVRQEATFYRLLLAHPRTPRLSRLCIGAALVYLVSPIDLVPDFVPVLGQLDDVIVVGLLLWLARACIPDDVIAACRKQADAPA